MKDFLKLLPDSGEGQSSASTPEKADEIVYVEKRDPVSQQLIKIPKALEPYIGHIISATRSQIESQYKPMLEKIESKNTELTEVREELTKLQEASLTAEEKAQKNVERKIKEYENEVKKFSGEAENWKNKFLNTKINNDIISAFKNVALNNPRQTMQNLIQEGCPRIEDIVDAAGKPTGELQTILKLKIMNDKNEIVDVEDTPEELFIKWINLPENLHHQKNNLNPGGGTYKGNGKGGLLDFAKLTAEQKLQYAFEDNK